MQENTNQEKNIKIFFETLVTDLKKDHKYLKKDAKYFENLRDDKCQINPVQSLTVDKNTTVFDLGKYIKTQNENNEHMVLCFNNFKNLCLDKNKLTHLKKGLFGLQVSGYLEKNQHIKSLANEILKKSEQITFHFSYKHPNEIHFIVKKENSIWIYYYKFENNTLYRDLEKVLEYGSANSGKSLEKGEVIYKIDNINKGTCYTINQKKIGGIINPRAKLMQNIQLNIQRPNMFIIGRYAHPKAPFIVLPLLQSWIDYTHGIISFHTNKGGKLKVFFDQTNKRLFVPTGHNSSDVFLIKHIVQLKSKKSIEDKK